jgi:hypothetical protein
MSNRFAILVAAVTIAAAATNRWEIAPHGSEPLVYRLDRWMGTVTICSPLAPVGAIPRCSMLAVRRRQVQGWPKGIGNSPMSSYIPEA